MTENIEEYILQTGLKMTESDAYNLIKAMAQYNPGFLTDIPLGNLISNVISDAFVTGYRRALSDMRTGKIYFDQRVTNGDKKIVPAWETRIRS